MDTTDVIAQLTAERDRIDSAIEALQAIDSPAGSTAQPTERKTARARKPRQTTAEFLSNETVLKLLTPEGVPAKTIRSRFKASDNQVLRVLKGLDLRARPSGPASAGQHAGTQSRERSRRLSSGRDWQRLPGCLGAS